MAGEHDKNKKKDQIYKLFPSHLLENKDYKSFIDIIADEYGFTRQLLHDFPGLTQVANTPEKFLQYLSYIVNYRVLDSEDMEVQRDILKRIFQSYEERGSESSIRKSAARANDPNWFREDLTYYKGPLKEEPVSLSYPQYQLFTWSKSPWSREDKFAEGEYWSDGIIIFNMTNMSQATKDAINRVIPAGRRYYFNNTVWIVSDDVKSDLRLLLYDYKLKDYQDITYYLRVRKHTEGMGLSINIPWDTARWSGRLLNRDFQDIRKEMKVSTLHNLNTLPLFKLKSMEWIVNENLINESNNDLIRVSNGRRVFVSNSNSTKVILRFLAKSDSNSLTKIAIWSGNNENSSNKYYANIDNRTRMYSVILDISASKRITISTTESPNCMIEMWNFTSISYDDAINDVVSEYIPEKKREDATGLLSVDYKWNSKILTSGKEYTYSTEDEVVPFNRLPDSIYDGKVIHDIRNYIPEFQLRKRYYGTHSLSVDYRWDGTRSLSGIPLGIISTDASFLDINPSDTSYGVDQVLDCKVGDYRRVDTKISGVDVNIYRPSRVIDSNELKPEGSAIIYDANLV